MLKQFPFAKKHFVTAHFDKIYINCSVKLSIEEIQIYFFSGIVLKDILYLFMIYFRINRLRL